MPSGTRTCGPRSLTWAGGPKLGPPAGGGALETLARVGLGLGFMCPLACARAARAR